MSSTVRKWEGTRDWTWHSFACKCKMLSWSKTFFKILICLPLTLNIVCRDWSALMLQQSSWKFREWYSSKHLLSLYCNTLECFWWILTHLKQLPANENQNYFNSSNILKQPNIFSIKILHCAEWKCKIFIFGILLQQRGPLVLGCWISWLEWNETVGHYVSSKTPSLEKMGKYFNEQFFFRTL